MKTESANPLPKTLPGAVCVQMVRCGKPSCKCVRGELHGPYFYHFQRINSALVKRYIKAADVAAIRAACEAHRKRRQQERSARQVSVRTLQQMFAKLREFEQIYSPLKES